jgi:hypothetical protein
MGRTDSKETSPASVGRAKFWLSGQSTTHGRVKRIELEEQKLWLAAQTQRLALIAMELDEQDRKIKLQEAQDKQDAWWKKCDEEAKVSTSAVMEHFQKSWTRPARKSTTKW